MYFRDRAQAGDMLANELRQYRYKQTSVLALSPGGVLVGEQIARRLHATLALLLSEPITAPGDASLTLGAVNQDTRFTYNDLIPAGEMEEYMIDMRGFLEEEKLRKIYKMTHLLGENGIVHPENLIERHVIITTDGVKNGMSFTAALNFLKYVRTASIIAAIPVGPANVLERISHQTDVIRYLYIPQNFFSVGHYYQEKVPTDRHMIMERINRVANHWL